MATRQLWIISLVLCSALPSATAVDWSLTVTNNIQAYQHDCVIINCTFEYKKCGQSGTPKEGIWIKEGMDVNLYHPNSSKIDPAFRGRTELLGNISQKNCTLKIYNLRKTDFGKYIFRVEGKTTNNDKCHYSYVKHPVTLKEFNNDTRPVITMDEVEVGSLATVTCSINYTCVSNPPDLYWSHEQRGNNSTVQNWHGDQWILTSNLTFQTQESDLDTVINCTAKYKNRSSLVYEEKNISTLLKLGYPPRIKKEACSKNQCVCVVDSRPPSVIKWLSSDGKSVISNISAKEYKVEYALNITDVNVRVLYCEAINRHGNSTESFSIGSSFPVLYIVISGFAVLIIVLLVAIFYMWRFRTQKAKCRREMPNPLYKSTQRRQNHIRQDAPRRPAPAVPEMCTDKEDMEDDDYIIPVRQQINKFNKTLESPAQVKLPGKYADEDYGIPMEENEGAHRYASRESLASAVPSRRSQSRKRKSRRQRFTDSYYIPEEMVAPAVPEMCTEKEDMEDDDYIIPAPAVPEMCTDKEDMEDDDYIIPVSRVEEEDEGIYNNVDCNIYANN